MANYTTNASDFTKGQVMRAWLIGAVGTLGCHYFKVGRIKAGIVHLIIGALLWLSFFSAVVSASKASGAIGVLLILAAISIFDLVRIQLGTFRDNVGAAVREP